MMTRSRVLLVAVCALVLSAAVWRLQSQTPSRQTAEGAYRANNVGVAHLEQYDFEAAVASFRLALEQDESLAMARLNLGIALFYAGQPDAARPELERARAALPDRPHADYVLGLIARATDRAEAALEAFTRGRRLDATDPGIAINIGQLQLQQRQYPEALASFKIAIAAEPYNATAAYGLATALIRSGASAEGTSAMERFEKLRASTFATTYSQTYLEQGRYAEAIASTGSERGLVDERTPAVTFVDATRDLLPASATTGGGAVALFDLDGDGDLELADAFKRTLRLFRNDGGRFAEVTAMTVSPSPPAAGGIVAADCDNDGDADLLVFDIAGPPLLLRQDATRKLVAVGKEAGLPVMHSVQSAAWLDADHDGDLDLVLAGLDAMKAPAVFLMQNNGEGKFTDVSATAALKVARGVLAVVPTDFDNRRDIDLFALSSPPLLFRNLRDGTFQDVAHEAGLSTDGAVRSVAVGDINKDTYPDFFIGRRGAPGVLASSDGRARFTTANALDATTDAQASQFLDYDNDGLIDLLVLGPSGPRMIRNLGDRWVDVSTAAFKGPARAAQSGESVAFVASGDLDGDGDVDLVTSDAGRVSVWRNEGGSAARSVRVQLTSRVSNRSAIGTKIEVRAGSLKERTEVYAATPAPAPAQVILGLGARVGADVVRILWPSGILQAETVTLGKDPAASAGISGVLKAEELDRKPSSCPYLYTWNGERFEFITDFLGGGEMGYWQAPGVRNTPDSDEYVRIEASKLKPRDGRYELRITNELEEALFLDHLKLVAVAHPNDVAVYPNEGLRSTVDPFRLYAVRDVHPPPAIVDEHGHDMRDRLARIDRRYADDFALERIRGYAAEHALTITLPSTSDRRVLLLNGWTDYSFSGDNVAAHQLGLRMVPPSLQIQDATGGWQTVIPEIGFPVGRPQTVVVDLTGKVPSSARQVRIVTTMRVYWDAVTIGTIDERAPTRPPRIERIDPVVSTLRWRGFSEQQSPDGKEPFGADYTRVSPSSPWKLMPGRYTREGDVRELLLTVDDKFVVSRPGDEIAVSFDAARVPAISEGWTVTFLLYTDGFSKEMDVNSASPDDLEPLPFHGMKQYPYPPSEAPRRDASYREYLERFNTRVIKRTLPPLELSVPVGRR